MRAVPLLLTATITPSDVPNLVVRDPVQRREEYLRATRFYLSLGLPVVLAENSGADLSDFRRLGSSLEVLQQAPSGEATLGRGFLETRLVIDAAHCSEQIASADGHFWKITGRYVVRNMARLVAKAQPSRDLYFNLRRHPELWADMWVYGASTRGMSLLEPNLGALAEEPAERPMYGFGHERGRSRSCRQHAPAGRTQAVRHPGLGRSSLRRPSSAS